MNQVNNGTVRIILYLKKARLAVIVCCLDSFIQRYCSTFLFCKKRHLATTVGIFREWLNWSTHDFYLPRRWQQLPYCFLNRHVSCQKLPGRVASDASRFTEEARGFRGCEFFEGGFCERAGGERFFFFKKKQGMRNFKLERCLIHTNPPENLTNIRLSTENWWDWNPGRWNFPFFKWSIEVGRMCKTILEIPRKQRGALRHRLVH